MTADTNPNPAPDTTQGHTKVAYNNGVVITTRTHTSKRGKTYKRRKVKGVER